MNNEEIENDLKIKKIANETFERLFKLLQEKDKEIERLNNIIYTTLEYVDREEINSIGTPYTYTERGKHIKELLEGERTFNSLWQENKRLNNIINEIEKFLDEEYEFADTKVFPGAMAGVAMGQINRTKNKLQELKGSDKE